MAELSFEKLADFLKKTPSIIWGASGVFEDGLWWVKFKIDVNHKLAWNVVQEIGFVANYLSVNERLPSVFYPVSPPPYLNGGPKDFLSWVIESKSEDFTPDEFAEWLIARLPSPVDDISQWEESEDNED